MGQFIYLLVGYQKKWVWKNELIKTHGKKQEIKNWIDFHKIKSIKSNRH